LARLAIEGLDVAGGLERLGGDEETYLEVLQLYVTSTPKILGKLRVPAEGALQDYAVAVHGVKGSSYNVGAELVGRRAERQELAAKAGDLAAVLAGQDEFFQAAEKLIAELEAFLAESGLTG
jgi:HPt (histidine-containing phosphotransfer) domain-containing protein